MNLFFIGFVTPILLLLTGIAFVIVMFIPLFVGYFIRGSDMGVIWGFLNIFWLLSFSGFTFFYFRN